MSDDEEQFNSKAHKNLLQAISSLGKVQHIRKTTRSEPRQEQNEFQLLKTATASVENTDEVHPVGINDLVKVLRTTKKHLDTGKQLKTVQATKKLLQKPLEKPAAERIKREIGYENVKAKLERWDAIVTQNRSAETQVFPLKSETIYVDTSAHSKPVQLSLKSDLMREMEATDAKLKALKRERIGDTVDEKEQELREQAQLKKKLTFDELRAKRKELAWLKIRESQKSAKARLKNKIKSKKYHKLLKRQKMQHQIKEFELLQKTNPEAALEKLGALEKHRVLERANLRHKNTGSWAKNLQIRAKYDKDVRKDLAEQLQISRQLTEKKNDPSSDDDGDTGNDNEKMKLMEVEQDDAKNDPFNPWTRVGKSADVKDNINTTDEKQNWRKYWLKRNENEKLLQEYRKNDAESVDSADDNATEISKNANTTKASKGAINMNLKKDSNKKIKLQNVYNNVIDDSGIENMDVATNDINDVKQKSTKNKSDKQKSTKTNNDKQKSNKKTKIENGWTVEEISKPVKINKNIDDIFDAQEDKLKLKLSKKLKLITKKAKKLKKARNKAKQQKTQKDELKNLKDLSFKNQANKPIIDEELNHDGIENEKDTSLNKTIAKTNASIATAEIKKNTNASSALTSTIDPNKLATVKLKQNFVVSNMAAMNDAIGDVDLDDDDDDEMNGGVQNEQQLTISQAFEDDDIIADFSKDKTKDSELKDIEIKLSMPGWGAWAGAGISKERTDAIANRNKRIVLKLAQAEKRRDDNKDGVYINEEASKHLRTHLVSDLPFPFTSVEAYEASIRAPLGRNFVPEKAFRLLTRPEVITQKGQIIEPMDESELLKKERILRNEVDRRIKRAAKEAESENK